MKELNRRTFLALSGASVAMLALAACGGAPSTPAAPTGKEAKVLEAINKYRGALPQPASESATTAAPESLRKVRRSYRFMGCSFLLKNPGHRVSAPGANRGLNGNCCG